METSVIARQLEPPLQVVSRSNSQERTSLRDTATESIIKKYTKAEARKIIGVSKKTMNMWIGKGFVSVDENAWIWSEEVEKVKAVHENVLGLQEFADKFRVKVRVVEVALDKGVVVSTPKINGSRGVHVGQVEIFAKYLNETAKRTSSGKIIHRAESPVGALVREFKLKRKVIEKLIATGFIESKNRNCKLTPEEVQKAREKLEVLAKLVEKCKISVKAACKLIRRGHVNSIEQIEELEKKILRSVSKTDAAKKLGMSLGSLGRRVNNERIKTTIGGRVLVEEIKRVEDERCGSYSFEEFEAEFGVSRKALSDKIKKGRIQKEILVTGERRIPAADVFKVKEDVLTKVAYDAAAEIMGMNRRKLVEHMKNFGILPVKRIFCTTSEDYIDVDDLARLINKCYGIEMAPVKCFKADTKPLPSGIQHYLVLRTKLGDKWAEETLVKSYTRAVWRNARGNEEKAHRRFTEIPRMIEKFDFSKVNGCSTPFIAYMFAALRNNHNAQNISEWREPKELSFDEDIGNGERKKKPSLHDVVSDKRRYANPVEAFERSELIEQLVHVIDNCRNLTEQERMVIKIRYRLLDELRGNEYDNNLITFEEVGALIGVKRQRVKQIEEKALSKIRKSGEIKMRFGAYNNWKKLENEESLF
ncbi:MAG: sigma factor-like helix-turn-helix DNA-binding protein [Candidatus Micrarchaeota archaeon]